MSEASLSRLRKRLLEANAAADEIDIAGCATVAYSSENPAHPVEHLFDGRSGPGASRWISARSDTIEHIVLEFDRPPRISRLVYEVEESGRERTQEVRVEVSEDLGRTYRQIFVQEYIFSPGGATYQREEQRFDHLRASHLRLTIVPNKNGSGDVNGTPPHRLDFRRRSRLPQEAGPEAWCLSLNPKIHPIVELNAPPSSSRF
jgi:F5/8 type C domain